MLNRRADWVSGKWTRKHKAKRWKENEMGLSPVDYPDSAMRRHCFSRLTLDPQTQTILTVTKWLAAQNLYLTNEIDSCAKLSNKTYFNQFMPSIRTNPSLRRYLHNLQTRTQLNCERLRYFLSLVFSFTLHNIQPSNPYIVSLEY